MKIRLFVRVKDIVPGFEHLLFSYLLFFYMWLYRGIEIIYIYSGRTWEASPSQRYHLVVFPFHLYDHPMLKHRDDTKYFHPHPVSMNNCK